MICFNLAKIICTIGPASADEEILRRMIEAGMDVARLNFSHGVPDEHALMLQRIRKIEAELKAHIGVIADLQGPKIRTGALAGAQPVELRPGMRFTITTRPVNGSAQCVSTTYPYLAKDVNIGDRILLDDGLIELRVRDKTSTDVLCEVIVGGTLREHKGINLPGVNIRVPALTEKDCADLQSAVAWGVDYIALSFVRTPNDILQARQLCQHAKAETPIIAKLERPEALTHLADIVAAADAIMIARGDLAVELSPEEVPIWQKRIVAECARQNKPVITATQMLESMRFNPQPTRAEASDVANAIFDGADAIMLSAETSIGNYPVQAVAMMRKIAAAAEAEQACWRKTTRPTNASLPNMPVPEAISFAAVKLAEDVGAKAIIAFTETGSTARLVSQRRPSIPILACTPISTTARRCSLYWGVTPLLVPDVADAEEMFRLTSQTAKELGYVQPGDCVVITAGVPMGEPGSTNTLSVKTIK